MIEALGAKALLIGGVLLLIVGLIVALVLFVRSGSRAKVERKALQEAGERRDEAIEAHEQAEREGREKWL